MDKSVGSHSFMNLHSYQFPCSRRRRDFWNGNFSHLFADCDIISSSEIWSTRESVMRSPSLLVSTENPFNIVCVQTLIAAAAQQTSALWILLFYRVWIRFVFIAWCYARCVEPSKLCPRWPPSAETSQLSNVPSFTPGEGQTIALRALFAAGSAAIPLSVFLDHSVALSPPFSPDINSNMRVDFTSGLITFVRVLPSRITLVGMLRFMSDINQASLPNPFYSVLVSISVFMALSTVFHSINSSDNSLFSHSVLPVLALPYWSFQLYNNISLRKSPSDLI